MLLIHPQVSYLYLKAMHVEGYWNPKEFTEAFLMRMGSNANRYNLNPLQPGEVAQSVYSVYNKQSVCLKVGNAIDSERDKDYPE